MCVCVCMSLETISALMAAKKKVGVVRRARDMYGKALCGCGGAVSCSVPQTSGGRRCKVGAASKEMEGEDLRGLIQLLSMGKGGPAKVDVDSHGNLVWRKEAAAETSYGGGVGRIGRIDEEKPCCFKESDVFNKLYSRGGSGIIKY